MDFDPFDKAVAVPLIEARHIGIFRSLAHDWPDEQTSRHYEDYVHAADVRRAAGPVVFSATMPGDAGTVVAVPAAGLVTWSPPVPGTAGSMTIQQPAAVALCTSGCSWSTSPGGR